MQRVCDHPSIITLLDEPYIDVESGRVVLALPLCNGDLLDRLESGKNRHFPGALMKGICDGKHGVKKM